MGSCQDGTAKRLPRLCTYDGGRCCGGKGRGGKPPGGKAPGGGIPGRNCSTQARFSLAHQAQADCSRARLTPGGGMPGGGIPGRNCSAGASQPLLLRAAAPVHASERTASSPAMQRGLLAAVAGARLCWLFSKHKVARTPGGGPMPGGGMPGLKPCGGAPAAGAVLVSSNPEQCRRSCAQ